MKNRIRWIGLIAAILLSAACSDPTGPVGPPVLHGDTVTLASGLQYIDARVGTGALAEPGDSVGVHYTGWLEDGTQFDTSRQQNRGRFDFRIGSRRVIPGWEQGVAGMRVGGKRRLIIPPDLAYGEQGQGIIPPNATLIFDIDLHAIIE